MNKNDIIKSQNEYFRILSINDNKLLVINCLKKNMPYWIENVDEYKLISIDEIYKLNNKLKEDIDEISSKRRKTSYTRFSLIAGIASAINDKNMYVELIAKASEESGISDQAIRKYLIEYLIYQDVAVLAPKKKEEPELSEDQKNYRWALNKFYYTRKKQSLNYAYNQMLKYKYTDENGKLFEKYPKYHQFYFFYTRTKKLQNVIISREGNGKYQRESRILVGDVSEEYPCIGTGTLDGTILDIFLVNDEGSLIGRPVLTACIDADTGLCLGYSLTWEGGTYNIRNLMLNIIADKVEHCKRFGIVIKEKEWNCSKKIPSKFITDKGSDFISKNINQLTELAIILEDLPSYRADLKPKVERFFQSIQDLYKPDLKGKGIIEPDFQERGAPDYRKTACLTMKEFEAILIRCILYYNNERIIEGYQYTDEMLKKKVKPHCRDIWNYKLKEGYSSLIPMDERTLSLCLLPRTNAKFSRYGLKANKLRYHRQGFTEQYLRGDDAVVAFSPDDASRIFLLQDGEYIQFNLIEKRFVDKSFEEAWEMIDRQNEIIKSVEKDNRQAQIYLSTHIQDIAKTKIKVNANTKDIKKTRKKEKRRAHKTIGGEIDE